VHISNNNICTSYPVQFRRMQIVTSSARAIILPDRSRRAVSCKNFLPPLTSNYLSDGHRGPFRQWSICRGVKLTNHFHLVPKSVCSRTSNPPHALVMCIIMHVDWTPSLYRDGRNPCKKKTFRQNIVCFYGLFSSSPTALLTVTFPFYYVRLNHLL
jgi:hypothetical protein